MRSRPPAGGEAPIWERLRAELRRMEGDGAESVARRERRLRERALALRGRKTDDRDDGTWLAFLAFSLGRQHYAVPLRQVVEVMTLEQYSPVPGTPAFLPGVVHWRGAILALLDLSKLLGIPDCGLSDVHTGVVVQADHRRVVLVARDVQEIHRVPTDRIQSPPELSGNIPAGWVIGVHDHRHLILDLEEILHDPRLTDWRKE